VIVRVFPRPEAFQRLRNVLDIDPEAFRRLRKALRLRPEAFRRLRKPPRLYPEAFRRLRKLIRLRPDAFRRLRKAGCSHTPGGQIEQRMRVDGAIAHDAPRQPEL
jgi:hypothetical protein